MKRTLELKTERDAGRAAVNDFTQGSMWRVIVRMGVPMMLAQLVNVLYNVVDRMYIGHMQGEGSLALTGLGLWMPVVTVITAFTGLCGGGGPLVSIARGKGDLAYAEKVMGNALSMLLIFAAALTALGELLLRPILFAMGASEATWPYASEYARIYLLGTVFVMLSLGMNYFINAQGFAKIGMLTVTIGALLNILLDPLFIFVLNMGISGAALATVLSQMVSAFWAMGFLMSSRAILDLRPENMVLDWAVLRRILALGVTGFIMSITNGIVQTAYNQQLRYWGGDLYVGAMTVIYSLREVFFMGAAGIRDGAGPVLGYNYGAGVYGRVKEGIRFVIAYSLIYSGLVWLLVMLLPGPLVRIFNTEAELVAVAVPALRIHFCGFMFMALMMGGQSVFVALGKARQAATFSILRKVIVATPLIFLLPRIAHWGVYGVFWAEPVSDLIGGAASFFTMYFTVYRRLPDSGTEPSP